MDIRTLNNLTGISVRSLRYVLDHKLVPERSWFVDKYSVGRSRTFNDTSAVLITCAAHLLVSGYKRDSVRSMMQAMDKVYPTNPNPLNLPVIANVISGEGSARFQFGDGRYVRWIIGNKTGEWLEIGLPTKIKPEASPLVIMDLDVAQIREYILLGKNLA